MFQPGDVLTLISRSNLYSFDDFFFRAAIPDSGIVCRSLAYRSAHGASQSFEVLKPISFTMDLHVEQGLRATIKPAASRELDRPFSMMPFCQCFARRVKAISSSATTIRHVQEV
ncbi:hypothetical protein I6F16_17025 [Bradyrhizobium sp. IC4060]|nr:hypothetical protein [Bradyrhizobium sp. IC4060]MCA1485458.1 hypothetical protein [Bradyrhizobium sp. IC4061]